MSSNKILFEISWEVCNKVGGIHTVITSKLNYISKEFENYYLIGPYIKNNKNQEFIQSSVPENFKEQNKIIEEKYNIKLHFGKWNLKNNPNCILIEYLNYSKYINEIKTTLWEKYNIDSMNSNWYDFDEAILWSWTAGIVIKELTKDLEKIQNENEENNDNGNNSNKINNDHHNYDGGDNNNNKYNEIYIHSHEWMSGGAIFYIKQFEELKQRYHCIFTTHATMLGRALCSNNENIYDMINQNNKKESNKINFDQKSYEINVHTKHQTEKALAKISDCFTTVSDITSKEAENFYNKKPDIILYNGIENNEEKTTNKIIIDYEKSRKKTGNFLEKYFHDFYKINLNKTQIYYTSGRFELKNKGIDLLTDSLNKLNKKLIEENSEKEVIVFFLVMMGEFEINEKIKNSIKNYENKTMPEVELPFAPISTHNIENHNQLIQKLIQNKLLNEIEDKVKVIVIPEMISKSNNKIEITNNNLYELIQGFDLGIFPSFYEPWGYTPVESITNSVPTITSNLSGFGRYIQENKNCKCVTIINRETNNYEQSSIELFEELYKFSNQTQKELLIEKINSFKFAKEFDWEIFIENYKKAYEFAKNKNL